VKVVRAAPVPLNGIRPGSALGFVVPIDEHARMLMDQKPRPDDIVGLTQNEIMRALHGGDPDRDVVAKRLA
jgi:hypothetical protein